MLTRPSKLNTRTVLSSQRFNALLLSLTVEFIVSILYVHNEEENPVNCFAENAIDTRRTNERRTNERRKKQRKNEHTDFSCNHVPFHVKIIFDNKCHKIKIVYIMCDGGQIV